jgi:hypothetical protein
MMFVFLEVEVWLWQVMVADLPRGI